ncbi:MAG: ribosome maturation factor RimP [Clostridia bacterium]|nr:ribosome maturation factor RimP [Clostridia bacterium]MBQ6937637.1 ribosome maturation factor RimP [Clostridia bacterium]
MAKIDEALEKIALDVCQRHGVYIYETEYKKEGSEYFLRLFIDKEGGVTIEDCENVSREISPLLDNLTFIKEAYIFEVSSPGIDRVLSRDWHFEKVMGEEIEIKLFAPLDGKKEFSGILKGYNDGIITIETEGKEIQIEKQKAASVRLAFKF